jgi:hypothetical protein
MDEEKSKNLFDVDNFIRITNTIRVPWYLKLVERGGFEPQFDLACFYYFGKSLKKITKSHYFGCGKLQQELMRPTMTCQV